MTRFILALFGKSYESCKSCEILKQQLEYERSEKQMLLETLTSLLKPQIIVAQGTIELKPITSRFQMFSKRRVELEKADAERARIERSSVHIAKSDDELKNSNKLNEAKEIKTRTVDDLEKELGIEEVVS